MNDVTANEAATALAEAQAEPAPGQAAHRSKLRPLVGLMPFVARYKGRAAAALIALLVAAVATRRNAGEASTVARARR